MSADVSLRGKCCALPGSAGTPSRNISGAPRPKQQPKQTHNTAKPQARRQAPGGFCVYNCSKTAPMSPLMQAERAASSGGQYASSRLMQA